MNRRKATESKKIILEAASEVFAERGYSGTTIREVARRAGISIGGIYIYFQNKEGLYFELTRDQMETFRKHTEMLRDKEPLAALKALIEYYLDYAINNPHSGKVFRRPLFLEGFGVSPNYCSRI
jgi:AcrR family transcriptional regulator